MALFKPLGGLPGLNAHIVLGGSDFDLHFLGFRDPNLRFDLLVLLGLLVLEFAVVGDFADRRDGVGGDFNEVEPGFFGLLECLRDRNDAVVFSRRTEAAHFRHTNAFIHAHADFFSLRRIFGESHLKSVRTKCGSRNYSTNYVDVILPVRSVVHRQMASNIGAFGGA